MSFLVLGCALPAVLSGAENSAPRAIARFSGEPKALYAAASDPAPPEGTDITVLEDEERYVFDASGRSVHTRYIVFKVLTQRGAENWDSISLEWEPWHEDRPQIRARVIGADLAVHELDPKTVTDAPAREDDSSLYTDARVLRAPLPAIAPGAVVEQELISTERAPLFGGGVVGRFFSGRVSIPVQHSRLILEAPSSTTLRYVTQLLPDLQPQKSEEKGTVRVVFERGPIAALEAPQDYLPPDVPGYPSITFSVGGSWQQIAEEYAKIVDEHVNGSDLKSLVAKITEGKKSREDKMQALLEYLGRNIRYTGIEFGEAAIVPHSPSETLAHKYGDCKDKSTLLAAMLRAAGIPAHIALLNAGGRMDVPTDLPGMGLFDHAIVYAPGPPDYWIDATDRYARLGQMPTADQGRLALVARPGTTALTRVPETPSRDNVIVESREFFLAENGPARVVETTRPQGSFESQYRSFYADQQDKEVRENLNGYVKNQYLAEKLDTFSRSDPYDLSGGFSLMLEARKAKRGFTDLDDAVVAIRLEGLFNRLPEELQTREKEEDKNDAKPKKPRNEDYQLPQAYVSEWQYRIVPPPGYQPKALPPNVQLQLGPASLKEEFSSAADGSVKATLRFDTGKRRLTVAEATEMRNKVADLLQAEPIMVNFEPAALALLRDGKAREAFQSYRSLIALHPKEAIHHLQIAKALLDAGLGDAARNEARTAVKLEPESALAQRTLADILQYDSVGRKLRPGSDYAGAIAAYRAAMKLEPDDTTTAANLAILLEYNDEGVRYLPGSHLKEAIAEYRKIGQEKLAQVGVPSNLAFALFYNGEFAEARRLAETLNNPPKALIVASEAALNGSQAALAMGNKRTNGEADFKSTVKTAGEMLMNIRQYAVAADLLQAGASGENASNTMGLAAMLRRARKHEEMQFGSDPAGVVMRFFLASLSQNVTIESLNTMVSRNARAVWKNMDEDERKKLTGAGKEMRRGLARSGGSPDVTLDILLQVMQPTVEGNDTTGYRVSVQPLGVKKMTMFVIKEEGEYRILDSNEKPNSLGLEVLDRLAANDLPGAAVLLDWIREEQHLEGGDDPLNGDPFPRFWTKGKRPDPRQMKLAAAALLAQTKATARQGVTILEEAHTAAQGESEKINIALALMTGYARLDERTQSLKYASELMTLVPESDQAFRSTSYNLRMLGKFKEAEELAQQRLARLPGDLVGNRVLIALATVQGDYARSYRTGQQIVASGRGDATEWNNLAWDSLFFQREGGPDLDAAIKAAQMSQRTAGYLHTLGCVYAELGRTKEAREVLIQAMDLASLDEPDANYWYAFGRVAEQYGEREVALSNYARVEKPKEDAWIPGSSYMLAQNRLKTLKAASNPVAKK